MKDIKYNKNIGFRIKMWFLNMGSYRKTRQSLTLLIGKF